MNHEQDYGLPAIEKAYIIKYSNYTTMRHNESLFVSNISNNTATVVSEGVVVYFGRGNFLSLIHITVSDSWRKLSSFSFYKIENISRLSVMSKARFQFSFQVEWQSRLFSELSNSASRENPYNSPPYGTRSSTFEVVVAVETICHDFM